MLGGGMELEWQETLDAEGNRNPEMGVENQMVGSHVGPYAGLNIFNPQPGKHYQWMLNPGRPGASPGDALQISLLKGVVVKEGDDEFAAFRNMEGMENTPLDTTTLFRELVLVKIPEEVRNALLQEIADKNARMLRRGPEESFVNAASHEERERYGNRGPTRFAMRGHQTEFTHGGDTVEVSIPDSGIVRTENVE